MKIAVLGAGSWGTTLAVLLDENGHRVRLWEFYEELAEALRKDGENKRFLPGISIPGSVSIETDMAAALSGANLVVSAVPSHVTRGVATLAAATGLLGKQTIVVNAAKGLEEGTLARMSEVLADELPVEPGQICTLAGPSHAEEVSRQMPTSVVAAGIDADVIGRVQEAFFRPYFRVYTNSDLVGVEVGVALKNIIAIAAGVCDGLGYGDNTKAALLTRGLVEITRLGCALGARTETFFGLAGIGDLIATALSRHSRNPWDSGTGRAGPSCCTRWPRGPGAHKRRARPVESSLPCFFSSFAWHPIISVSILHDARSGCDTTDIGRGAPPHHRGVPRGRGRALRGTRRRRRGIGGLLHLPVG